MTTLVAVTGTDTAIGKTVVACAIAADGVARGLRVRVFKPVETGVADPHEGRDAHLLRDAAASVQSIEDIAPFSFRDPLAPMAAAEVAGISIEARTLDDAFALATADADLVVVEGAGGLLVPVSRTESFASLFRRWHLPIIVVAPNRLGVMNHVLLTVRAAHTEGLTVAAVVIHDRAASESDPSAVSNAANLAALLPLVPIVRFPWVPSLDHPVLVRAARDCGLVPLPATTPPSPS